jgi:hypothetical protein
LPYWYYADRFGWFPSQVRAESHLEIWALGQIDQVMQDLRAKARQRSGQAGQVVEEAGGGGRTR